MWFSQATRRQLFKLDLTFKMFDMHKSIVWFALCNLCASLNDQSHCQDSCDTVMISASLRSSILLPCHAPFLYSSRTDWMLWVQNTGAPLVNLSSQGKVRFLEPREGRVKTFPNEGSRGNYTIRIDGLQESDLGCYQCGPADACHQVVVKKEEVDLWLPLCITAGVTTVILFVCFCCYKAFSRCKGCSLSQRGTRKRQENDEQDPADIGLSEDERLARNQDQGPPETIHDYEEPSESVAPCRPVRGHPQLERTRSTERKHALLNREIFSRLRQASRHFYVNQDEIIQQRSSAQKERRPRAGLRGKKAKQRYENPLYNSSPSQINHL
ncbi:unnamed protein product [Arctogadus glacialis]